MQWFCVNSVFLIDHSWTYLPENCYQQLHSIPGLAHRMANLMDLINRPATPTLSSSESEDEGEDEGARVNGNGIARGDGGNSEDSSQEESDPDQGCVCVHVLHSAIQYTVNSL